MLVKERKKVKLDQTGRLYLSKEERAQFGEKVIITRDANHLLFFTEEEWNQLVTRKLAGLKSIEFRRKRRAISSSASLEKIDKWERVFIPVFLRN